MRAHRFAISISTCAFGATLLAGCGGGSSSGVPSLPSVPQPSSTPLTATASGRVLDYATGLPIAGATVVIGNTVILGASAPATLPGDDKSAVTANDGTYTIAGLNPGSRTYACGGSGTGDGWCSALPPTTNAAFAHVFTSDHITLHGFTKVAAGTNAIADLKVQTITSAQSTRLAKLNSYRTQVGAPPVVLDEYLQEASDFYATWGENPPPGTPGGIDSDQGPNGWNYSPNSRYHSRGGMLTLDDWENLGGGPCTGGSITAPEDSYWSEGPTGGHYQRMIDAAFTWVGLGLGSPDQYGCRGGEEDFTSAPQ